MATADKDAPIEPREPLGERILVVDDEANMRTVLCALLERDGLAAVEAADGTEALERLRAAPFAFAANPLAP